MMGRGHATMGAAVWLAGCAAARLVGAEPGLAVCTVGTAVCAGWALAPDLDHPKSTVAQSVGPITRLMARVIAEFGVAVHEATKTSLDRPDRDGHRTVTHTLVWAVMCGLLAAAAGRWGGPWTAAGLVFFAASVGLHAALPRKRRWLRFRTGFKSRPIRKIAVPVPLVVAAQCAYTAYGITPEECWWLGLAVGVGAAVHCVGDMLTDSACPFLWPLPIGSKGQRRVWYPVGTPKLLRFNAGGDVEEQLVQPLLTMLLLVAATVTAWPVLTRAWLLVSGAVETMRAGGPGS